MDKRGKIRKKYDQTFVPYERLKSLNNAEQSCFRTPHQFQKPQRLKHYLF
jgi:hypothetical protein